MLTKVVSKINALFFSDESQQDAVLVARLARMPADKFEEAFSNLVEVMTGDEKKDVVKSLSKDKGLRPYLRHEFGV